MHKICNYFVMFLGLFCLFFFTVDTIIDLNILKKIIITKKHRGKELCYSFFYAAQHSHSVSDIGHAWLPFFLP